MIGVMSGTSVDGIDVAIVRMADRPELVYFHASPMPDRLREPLLRLCEPGLDEIDAMGQLHMTLGEAYARAIMQALKAAGLAPEGIAAIGLHGQTIRHRPRACSDIRHPFSLQIGAAAVVAERTGITAVSDFRSRDIAAGGCGAPLVPFAHRTLFAQSGKDIVVLNIGGIANITWLGADGATIGFDTGPGNMIMDALMLTLSDGRARFDADGELAARGTPCEPLLARLMRHPFLSRQPPKSTGREDFGSETHDIILGWPDISDADRLATALELTARSIADSRVFLPRTPNRWLVCGGGSRNTRLMARLAGLLAPASVASTGEAGMPPEAVEAVCFAVLARHTLQGTPNTLPAVTGASHAVCGGHITPGRNWPAVLELLVSTR